MLPFLLLLYLCAFDGSQAVSASNKVEAVADTVGDLVARSTTMNATRLANIMAISGAILAPLSLDGLVISVAAVRVDSAGKATVDWSKDNAGAGLAKGTPFALPGELQGLGDTYFIVATVTYPYHALISYGGVIDRIEMGKTYSFRPRKSAEIPFG